MDTVVIGDIHGNYPALKKVFDNIPSTVENVICTGDIIGLMGYPKETVELLYNDSDITIKGNHDVAVIDYEEGHVNNQKLSKFEYNYTWRNLSSKYINWLKELNTYHESKEKGLIVAHAKPYIEESSGYKLRNRGVKKKHYTKVSSNIDDSTYNFVLLGHTHEQAALDTSRFHHDVIVLNPGTVGQNKGIAEYALIDTKKREYSLENVSYDFDKVIEKLKKENVPINFWNY